MQSAPDPEFPRTPLPSGESPGLADLAAMFDEMRRAPEIYRPSRFWEGYSELNLRQLGEDGFGEFKRTVNRNYFQFQLSSRRDQQVRGMVQWWRREHGSKRVSPHYAEGFELDVLGRVPVMKSVRKATYARYLAILAEFVSERDSLGLLDKVEEPEIGHPICIERQGRRVSEDLCNSTLELTAVVDAVTPERLERATAIELGSGYGRLAWLYKKAFPAMRYVLVDIPPALAVAEQYLAHTLPDAKIFGFRQFERESEVEAELAQADLVFLTPNQLDQLPSLRADLFVNVSSLHEMVPAQVEHYLGLIARHTTGWFYTKQWIESVNAADDVVIRRDTYPIPSRWKPLFDRVHPVQQAFFEALYELPA